MAHGENMIARLNRATQSPSATILLIRLIFWHKTTKGREMGGKKWIPNSWQDWAKETGLSREQIRKAFQLFEKLNLAETQIAVYRTRKTLHSRPSQRAEAIADGSMDVEDMCSPEPAPGFQGTHDEVLQNPAEGSHEPCYIQGVIQGDTKEKNTGGPFNPQEGTSPSTEEAGQAEKEESSKEKKLEEEKTPKKKNHVEPEMGKMADAISLAKAKEKMHKPDTVASLRKQWVNAVFEEQGSMVVITKKHQGQLKMLLGRWEKPDDVMAYVLARWTQFAAKVASDVGLKDTPAYPNLDFLLKHASIAGIYAEPKTPMVHEAPKATSLPKVLPVQSIAKPKHQPATMEEMQAIMKEQKANG